MRRWQGCRAQTGRLPLQLQQPPIPLHALVEFMAAGAFPSDRIPTAPTRHNKRRGARHPPSCTFLFMLVDASCLNASSSAWQAALSGSVVEASSSAARACSEGRKYSHTQLLALKNSWQGGWRGRIHLRRLRLQQSTAGLYATCKAAPQPNCGIT